MKRAAKFIGFICFTVFIIGFAYGYLFYTADDQKQEDQVYPVPGLETPKDIGQGEEIQTDIKNPEGEMISPDAVLVLSRYYAVCGHTTVEETQVPKDMVNLTLEELRTAYKDWEIREFSDKRVMMLKQMPGKCPEHYILREKDGKVAIYYETPVDGIDLKEVTSIPVENLRKEDRANLTRGIKAASKRELAQVLEDLGS